MARMPRKGGRRQIEPDSARIDPGEETLNDPSARQDHETISMAIAVASRIGFALYARSAGGGTNGEMISHSAYVRSLP
jgi:hypothetical protein